MVFIYLPSPRSPLVKMKKVLGTESTTDDDAAWMWAKVSVIISS